MFSTHFLLSSFLSESPILCMNIDPHTESLLLLLLHASTGLGLTATKELRLRIRLTLAKVGPNSKLKQYKLA